jgi:ribosomal protein S27E
MHPRAALRNWATNSSHLKSDSLSYRVQVSWQPLNRWKANSSRCRYGVLCFGQSRRAVCEICGANARKNGGTSRTYVYEHHTCDIHRALARSISHPRCTHGISSRAFRMHKYVRCTMCMRTIVMLSLLRTYAMRRMVDIT